eukprot:m.192204 g.192204  ORF g.192204 m.192204 type:complete len:50 (-) comp13650_c2_seq5:728-877(-)
MVDMCSNNWYDSNNNTYTHTVLHSTHVPNKQIGIYNGRLTVEISLTMRM